MIDTYADFVTFITDFVLPIKREHPDWARLDGQSAGKPAPTTRAKRVALIIHDGRKFGVDNDAIIENLLGPYRAWQAGEVDYPVVVGKTRNGRPMLVPSPGAGVKTGFFIYLQGSANGAVHLPPTVSVELPTSKDPGPGEIAALIMKATQRATRDAAFRKRIFKRWGSKCALTGCEDEEVLDAAHIKAYSKSGDNRASNGIPLRSDLHRLMDRGLLFIDMAPGTLLVTVAPSVRSPEYKALNKTRIAVPD